MQTSKRSKTLLFLTFSCSLLSLLCSFCVYFLEEVPSCLLIGRRAEVPVGVHTTEGESVRAVFVPHCHLLCRGGTLTTLFFDIWCFFYTDLYISFFHVCHILYYIYCTIFNEVFPLCILSLNLKCYVAYLMFQCCPSVPFLIYLCMEWYCYVISNAVHATMLYY